MAERPGTRIIGFSSTQVHPEVDATSVDYLLRKSDQVIKRYCLPTKRDNPNKHHRAFRLRFFRCTDQLERMHLQVWCADEGYS